MRLNVGHSFQATYYGNIVQFETFKKRGRLGNEMNEK